MNNLGINLGFFFTQVACCLSQVFFTILLIVSLKYKQLAKPVVMLIGLATAWVAVYQVVFFSLSMMKMYLDLYGYDERFILLYRSVDALNLVLSQTFDLTILLMVFYLYHIVKFPDHSKNERFLYGIGLFFAPFIFMPVYYLCFVLNGRSLITRLKSYQEMS